MCMILCNITDSTRYFPVQGYYTGYCLGGAEPPLCHYWGGSRPSSPPTSAATAMIHEMFVLGTACLFTLNVLLILTSAILMLTSYAYIRTHILLIIHSQFDYTIIDNDYLTIYGYIGTGQKLCGGTLYPTQWRW